MRMTALKLLMVLLLGAFLSGPLFESVDPGDDGRKKSADVTLASGGFLVTLAAAVALTLARRRRARPISISLCKVRLFKVRLTALCFPAFGTSIDYHSPPLFLRI